MDARTAAPVVASAFVEEPSDSYDEGGTAVLKADETIYVRTDASVVALR
ncbi:hypothetical protein [Actinoallomurus sp. CA-150999]